MRRNFSFFASLLIAAILVIVFQGMAAAQAAADTIVVPPPFPGEPGGITIDFLLKWTDALYGALLVISGYFANKIPFLKNLPNTGWRVAAIALVIAMAFLVAGKGVPLSLIGSYLLSTKFYELILALIRKTPKPDEPLLPKG